MAAENVELFLRRAEDFSRGMKLLREDASFIQSAALLAIHAAIAYSDALRTGLGETGLSADDHQTAAKTLRARIGADHVAGITRLEKLLSQKSDVAYGNRRIETQRLQLICIDSERFAVWANKIGVSEHVSGWRTEHD